jgi:hypothetical protein
MIYNKYKNSLEWRSMEKKSLEKIPWSVVQPAKLWSFSKDLLDFSKVKYK